MIAALTYVVNALHVIKPTARFTPLKAVTGEPVADVEPVAPPTAPVAELKKMSASIPFLLAPTGDMQSQLATRKRCAIRRL